MQEIEVKILDIEEDTLIQRLQTLGAKKHFDGEMVAMFYDFPAQQLQHKKGVLRLRKEGDEVALTLKTYISSAGAKIMEEQEVKVSDLATMQNILTGLGMEITRKTRKYRVEYLLNQTKIVFDKYEEDLAFIPLFIEVEAPDLVQLYETVLQLGYKIEDCKSWNTFDLIQHYKYR
ncbi:MAG: class IV adenylate cyclase [Bacteroidia bacterium]